MYLYFDKNGTLKEIINDKALRQGNYGINKLYVYIDDTSTDSIDSFDVRYLLPSGATVGPQNYNTLVEGRIPYDAKRDLKWFKYNVVYPFYVIDLAPDEEENDVLGVGPLDETGTVHCNIIVVMVNGSQLVLGDINFNVELNSVLNEKYIAPQQYMDLANYEYLRKLIRNNEVDIATINLGSSTSGTITSEQYDLISEHDFCMVKNSYDYYTRVRVNSVEQYTYHTFINVELSGNNVFVSKIVVKSDLTWERTDFTITKITDTQIDSLFGGGA